MAPRVFLIGARSVQFGLRTLSDVLDRQSSRGGTILVHDTNPASQECGRQVGHKHMDAHQLASSTETATTSAKALTGADFCVITTEVGDRNAPWEQGWYFDQQCGVRQAPGACVCAIEIALAPADCAWLGCAA